MNSNCAKPVFHEQRNHHPLQHSASSKHIQHGHATHILKTEKK